MKERDQWNLWSVKVARALHVPCDEFASEEVAEQYAELRSRINAVLNIESSTATPPHPEQLNYE